MQENRILKSLNVIDITQYHKNKFPWFFIDYIDEIRIGEYVKGYKQFSVNESYFSKTMTTVPLFIQAESLEQLFLMTFLSFPQYKNMTTNTITSDVEYIKEANFGDTMIMESSLKSFSRGIARGESVGYIDGIKAISAKFTVIIPKIMNMYTPVKQ